MDDQVVRDQLVRLLTGEQAHVGVLKAVTGLPAPLRAARPAQGLHSVWEELEHVRLAQQDILRYTLDAAWKSPKFPEGYWPPSAQQVDDREWESSVARFKADLDEVCALVRDTKYDLTARLPHGKWRTYLRQILLIADHNAYHGGQIVHTRRALGSWQG